MDKALQQVGYDSLSFEADRCSNAWFKKFKIRVFFANFIFRFDLQDLIEDEGPIENFSDHNQDLFMEYGKR